MSSEQPFLSLCLIVRDAAETIEALLDSVLNQKNGPMCDELVIVDTGSRDDTKAKILKAVGLEGFKWEKGTWGHDKQKIKNLVLDNFIWIDDFAAARNYSFSLATGKWRMYLDADDVVDKTKNLKATIKRTEATKPDINLIILPYQYTPSFLQDKFRVARWADGFTWKDEIHEYLDRPNGVKVMAKYDDYIVTHGPRDGSEVKSLDRNIRICGAAREKAAAAGDERKVALMCYYLGDYAYVLSKIGHPDMAQEAIDNMNAAAEGLAGTNIGTYALVKLATIAIENKDYTKALDYAALAIGRTPEIPEGHAALGIAHTLLHNYEAATSIFERLFTMRTAAIQTQQDAIFNQGICYCHAAQAFLAVGKLGETVSVFAKVPRNVISDPRVFRLWSDTRAMIAKVQGIQILKQYVDFLIWDTQPLLALEVLERFVPAAIEEMPQISQLKEQIKSKLPHIGSFENYKKTYNSLPDDDYDPSKHSVETILGLGRAQGVLAWAAQQAPEGPDLEVCSIGPQVAVIERALLQANKRIKIVINEISEQGSPILEKLKVEFPGRVKTHSVKTSVFDWAVGPFDMVFMLEVIEHLEEPAAALSNLKRRLKGNGTLLLSTPVADRWIESHLSAPDNKAFCHHLQAFSPGGLWKLFQNAGFIGRITATDAVTTYFAEMKIDYRETELKGRVSIYVPGGIPFPFDPDSPLREHVGGSEEAVIYLAPELVKLGWDVTVYSPFPERSDGLVVYVDQGVRWKDASEFDIHYEHQNVMFWRCPAIAQEPWFKTAKWKKWSWCHDAVYLQPQTGICPAIETKEMVGVS